MKHLSLALAALMVALSWTSAASAAPRTGSIDIPGGAPLMNGGVPSQDMTHVSGFYSPETGLFDVTIRFAAPVSSSESASIYVYPRTDPSGACAHNIDDGFLVGNTEPEYQSLLGTTKRVSADHYEITLEDEQHTNVDFRCVFVKIGTFEKTYDELSPPLYFEGYGPPSVIQPIISQPIAAPNPVVIPVVSLPSPKTEFIVKPKQPTTKQLLARALAKCKKVKNKKKRTKCIATAKKHFSPKKG
jgi:hypothetical protein